MKRLVIISDLHCGHVLGLTHPDFEKKPDVRSKAWPVYKQRRTCWRFIERKAEELQPVDVLLVNGDAIEGKGEKSGGTELLESDRTEQVEMAAAAIELFKAGAVILSHGTPFHVGVDEDWENLVATHKSVNAIDISSHGYLEIEGVLFEHRHFVSRSIIPHGRFTSIARERMWNVLWAERDEYPKADVLIRSHVHYHVFCGESGWLAMTTPSLQNYGTKFGERKMSGTVDYGFVHFDIGGREDYGWKSHILRFKRPRRHIVKV